MSDRDRRLQSVGSLLGRAAGHGVLYGVLQREAVLYVNQAKEKMRALGKLHRGEDGTITDRAAVTGSDTIAEAFKQHKKVQPESEAEALSLLPREIERCWRKMGADVGGADPATSGSTSTFDGGTADPGNGVGVGQKPSGGGRRGPAAG